MIVVKESDWRRIGQKYYLDVKDFEFICPVCKHKQSVNSIMKNNSNLTEKEVRDFITCECEGRHTENKGCDWCLYGLFQVHNLEILQEDGKRFNVFDFADFRAMEELTKLAVDVSKIEEKAKRLKAGTLWICIKDFEAQPSTINLTDTPRYIKKGEIVEFRYFHPANFRTIEDKFYQANEGLFLECFDIYGVIFENTTWENRDKLKDILDKRLFQPELNSEEAVSIPPNPKGQVQEGIGYP